MIILIGGSSHVGKTYISQKLMEKLAIPYVSLDHIKMMFIRSKLTDLTVEDDLEMRDFLWPYMAEYIKTAVENHQNLIVEGCYIPFDYKKCFSEEYLSEIKLFYVVMSEQYIRNNFDKIKGYANVIERRLDDNPDMERLIKCSRDFKEGGLENGATVIEIDGDYDIDEIVGTIVEMVSGTGEPSPGNPGNRVHEEE